MATAPIEITVGVTGLTLTLDLYPLGSDTAGASGITLTEATNRKGVYTGSTTAGLTGEYQAFVKNGTAVIFYGWVIMSDDVSTHRVTDAPWVGDKSGTSIASVAGAVASVTAGVTVTTNNDKTGYSLTQSFPTNFSALGISVGGHISNVDTLTTYTGNTVQTGDAYARLGPPVGASVSADIAAAPAAVWAVGTRTLTAFAFTVTASSVTDKTGYALTSTYDAAKTAAQAGNQMDLVNAPNATAVTAIQSGLATSSALSSVASAQASQALQSTLNSVGGLVVALGSPMQAGTSVTLAASQSLYAPAKAGDAMTLTSAYDAAKTAAQAGDAMTLTSGERSSIGTAVWATATRTLTAFAFTVTTTDPLLASVPGSYSPGTAGYELGRIETIYGKVATIGDSDITIVSPTVPPIGGTLRLLQGDSYQDAEGASLSLTDSGDTWPDLTGAAVKFVAELEATADNDDEKVEVAGTVVVASGTGKAVKVQLTAAESELITEIVAGRDTRGWLFSIYVILSNGHIQTLTMGPLRTTYVPRVTP